MGFMGVFQFQVMRSSFRKYKIAFYSVYFSFWIISVIFAFEFPALNNHFGVNQFYSFLKVWAIIGLVVIFVGWIIENIHIYQIRKRNKRLEVEVLELKAELYNYIKKAESQQNETAPTAEEEKESNTIMQETTAKPEENVSPKDNS